MNNYLTNLKTIILKEKKIEKLSSGHWWIFSNQIKNIDTSIEKGSICKFEYSDGKPAGTGFFNPHSLIAGRLLVKDSFFLNKNFIEERISKAFEYRKQLGFQKSYRLFFGESDFIGGLIVDKYDDILVVDLMSAGVDKLKEEIVKSITKIFSPKGIIIKRDHQYRILENLEIKEPEIIGKVSDKIIEENDALFKISFSDSQKTGWYFDQSENRKFLIPYFENRKVLDLYCYTGAFSILAAKNGADMVWGIDSSQSAIERAIENSKLNKLPENKIIFKKEDAINILNALEKKELPIIPDFIVLDPPNFVRNKKHLYQAIKLYKKILSKALIGMNSGYVAFSTCSQHINTNIFNEIIDDSTKVSRKKIFILEARTQAKDHPILAGMEETKYLNFALLRII